MLKRAIKSSLQVVINPEKAYKDLPKRTFENITTDYIILLLLCGIVGGLVSILLNLAQAFYFNIFFKTPIQFLRMFNYSLGIATSIFFLYLFSGTVFFFVLSLIFKVIFNKIRYTTVIAAMMYAMSPLLLFSWLPFSKVAFGVWSILIFILGIRILKNVKT